MRGEGKFTASAYFFNASGKTGFRPELVVADELVFKFFESDFLGNHFIY